MVEMSSPVAVIDIGSNSVRLMVFDGLKPAASPIYNEKSICGLARGLEKNKKLDSEAVAKAHVTLQRFIFLSRRMAASQLYVFATSAVRDAKDGPAFVKELEQRHHITVKILSENEEALFAGYGVLSSFDAPEGVVGDLGGGSFELTEITKHEQGSVVGQTTSYPLGPIRFLQNNKRGIQHYRDQVTRTLSRSPLIPLVKDKHFYAVGGAFRNLAIIHMGRTKYPLRVIHYFEVSCDDLRDTLGIISRMSLSALQQILDVSKKRLEILPYAASLMDCFLDIAKPKNILFSAHGVREGLLYSKLDSAQQSLDWLICAATYEAARNGSSVEYGKELARWIRPVVTEYVEDRLLLSASLLSDIALYENTSYRAILAYKKIVDSSLPSINHRERVFLATILYHRYRGSVQDTLDEQTQMLLPLSLLRQAQTIGLAIRLGRSISGSHSGGLDHTNLTIQKRTLILSLKEDAQALLSEEIDKRVKRLASIMELDYKITLK